jgi:hypothetical protein
LLKHKYSATSSGKLLWTKFPQMPDEKWNHEFEDPEGDNVFPGLDCRKVSEEGNKWEWNNSRMISGKTEET